MGKKKEKAQKPPKRFVKVFKEKTSEEDHYVLADRETGVHYLLIQNGVGCGTTPLLDEKGKVVIAKLDIPLEPESALPLVEAK